jgi:hypothetical protein
MTENGDLLGQYTEPIPSVTLDLSCIGALVVEFAADYAKLAKDMDHLDSTSSSSSSSGGGDSSSSRGLQCLMVELDQGVVGIAKAAKDIYVIALAGTLVDRSLLKGRLMALAQYIEPYLVSYQSRNGSFCP